MGLLQSISDLHCIAIQNSFKGTRATKSTLRLADIAGLAAVLVVKHHLAIVATVGLALERELRRNQLRSIGPIMGWSWRGSINSGGKRAGSSVIEQAFETIVIGGNIHQQGGRGWLLPCCSVFKQRMRVWKWTTIKKKTGATRRCCCCCKLQEVGGNIRHTGTSSYLIEISNISKF